MPLEGAGDEAGMRAHLMQQRHHFVMRIESGARREGDSGGGGNGD